MAYFDVFYLPLGLSFQSHASDCNHEAYIFFPKMGLQVAINSFFMQMRLQEKIKCFKTGNKTLRIINILCQWLLRCSHFFLPQETNSSTSDKRARIHDTLPKLECINTVCSSSQFHLTIFNNRSILEHLESRKLRINSIFLIKKYSKWAFILK